MTENHEIATSPRLVTRKRDQQVRRFVRRIRTLAPHLDNPIFAPQLTGFAQTSLMLAQSYSFVRERGVIGDDGELRASVDAVRRLAETQARLAKELGLTPATLQAMAKGKAIDLAARFADISDG